MKAIFNLTTGDFAGYTEDPMYAPPSGFAVADLPADWNEANKDAAMLVNGVIVVDAAQKLAAAKATRKARIKNEASTLITGTDWQLERAREQESVGWVTLAAVDAVLVQREAIRRSSSAAEDAVDAMTDIASVNAFAWSVTATVQAPRRLTQTQFLGRFTDAEATGVLAAAAANPALNLFWQKMMMADWINIDDPETKAGINALEIAGLIAPGRALEIEA